VIVAVPLILCASGLILGLTIRRSALTRRTALGLVILGLIWCGYWVWLDRSARWFGAPIHGGAVAAAILIVFFLLAAASFARIVFNSATGEEQA
jgi:hypothetical protein